MPQAARDRGDRRRQHGFTLIEIMVVIVILGLLATLVIPNVIGMSDEAKIGIAQSNCTAIASAAKLYRTRTGKVPTMQELTTPDEKGFAYLEDVSVLDPWDNEYVIRELDRGTFEVISWGPDRTEGTSDDISSRPKAKDR